MIIFRKKNIHKWGFWRKKSKIVFCITSGLIYAIIMFSGSLLFNFLSGNTRGDAIESGLSMALGAFIAVTFLSIAHWYENERRYKEWLKEKESQ